MLDEKTPTISPTHFAYRQPSPDEDLQQGDILRRTGKLNEILGMYFPYYKDNPNNTHFIVLTQSCDLVKRAGNSCKSQYIALAPIRPIDYLLAKELKQYQKNPLRKKANVCGENNKQKLIDFMYRLMNNNETEYFYLHSDKEVGFPENSCAYLRLSVSIKSHEHYQACVDARIVSLEEIFQAKLGWLLGNVYSRVGTIDFIPDKMDKQAFNALADVHLHGLCGWVETKKLQAAEKKIKLPEIDDATLEELRRHISEIETVNSMEIVAGRVNNAIREMGVMKEEILSLLELDENEFTERLSHRLENDPQLKRYIKV